MHVHGHDCSSSKVSIKAYLLPLCNSLLIPVSFFCGSAFIWSVVAFNDCFGLTRDLRPATTVLLGNCDRNQHSFQQCCKRTTPHFLRRFNAALDNARSQPPRRWRREELQPTNKRSTLLLVAVNSVSWPVFFGKRIFIISLVVRNMHRMPGNGS